jgi:hypothetical protein
MTTQSDLAEQLRAELAANRGKHYPAHLRKAAVAYWDNARAHGISRHRISKALGMNLTTLTRWCPETAASSATGAMLPVEVVEQVTPNSCVEVSRIVVHTSSGLRIEGLDIKALVELVRSSR